MTVNTTTNKALFDGNGAATTFAYTFPIPDATYLQLWYTDASGTTTQVPLSGYSVTGIGSPIGGIVTYPLSGAPIPNGSELAILRVLPYKQTTDLVNQSGFYPNVVEGGLDDLEMQLQQLIEVETRNLTVAVTDSPPGQLPAAAARASQLLGFDASGNAIAAQPSSAIVSTAMQPVVNAATVAIALALLGGSSLPAGIEVDWPGLVAPTGWYLEYGQTENRAANPNLLAALAPTFACVITSGSNAITGISSTDGWYTGMPIESAGFPSGTTITVTSSTTATASVNATAASSAMQVFPWGNGDGATTFNMPDGRGYVYAGKDNMGGTPVNRLTTAQFGDATILGKTGGNQGVTLTQAQLSVALGTAASTVSDPGHGHSGAFLALGTQSSAGGSYTMGDVTVRNTGQSATGISVATTITNAAGGNAHSNVQPTSIRNKIIKGG